MLSFFRRNKPAPSVPDGFPASISQAGSLRTGLIATASAIVRRRGLGAADVAAVESDLPLAVWTLCGYVTQELGLAHTEATAGRSVPPTLLEQAFFFMAATPIAMALEKDSGFDYARVVSLQALWFQAERQTAEAATSSADLARRIADQAIEATLTRPDRIAQRKAMMTFWEGVKAYAETDREDLLTTMRPIYPFILHQILGPAVQEMAAAHPRSGAPAP